MTERNFTDIIFGALLTFACASPAYCSTAHAVNVPLGCYRVQLDFNDGKGFVDVAPLRLTDRRTKAEHAVPDLRLVTEANENEGLGIKEGNWRVENGKLQIIFPRTPETDSMISELQLTKTGFKGIARVDGSITDLKRHTTAQEILTPRSCAVLK